jgi:hypothetical protein
MTATITTTTPIGSYGAIINTNGAVPSYGNVTIASGTSGQYMYGNGTNSVWTSPNTVSIGPVNNQLHVRGDADFEGDVKIKGKSIVNLINNIEQRLAILHPNEKLEEKWEDLKKLGDMYRQLEQEILEKEKMWAILKK